MRSTSLIEPSAVPMKLTLASLCFLLAVRTNAVEAIFQRLHSFGLTAPTATLVQASDGNLYGTTAGGGTSGLGTIFQMTTDGTLSLLHSFSGGNDGANPEAGLVQASDGKLYGTTQIDGTGGNGTVFQITTNGSFKVMYSFTSGADGSGANSLVQASDGFLYGTAAYGGVHGNGTVFRITTNGTFSLLYFFTGGTDGSNPRTGLVQASDGNLYGTTFFGGSAGYGIIFRITTGSTFSTLHSFTGIDGKGPSAAMVQATNGSLYGTALYGGASGYGTAFRIGTNGTFATLHSFTFGADGAYPHGSLTQAGDGQLYGTAWTGGTPNYGTIFKMTINGTMTLYSFAASTDGLRPYSGLVQASDGNFYGTTVGGFNANGPILQAVDGTFFQFTTNRTLNTLYSFVTGNDSKRPNSLVLARDGTLYGTVGGGQAPDLLGAVFQITTNGTFGTLYSFTDQNAWGNPGGLVQAFDGNLYGTAAGGSGIDSIGIAYGNGAAFQIGTNGLFNLLYAFFGGDDGSGPAGLVPAADGNLYGTTQSGGANGSGTVFQLTTNGTATTLHSFTSGTDGSPANGLIQGFDGNFYGTTQGGGANSNGTIFRITTAGKFDVLHSLSGKTDGSSPYGRLVQGNDGNLYGTTFWGGANGYGSVFQITTNGIFAPLYSFTGGKDGGRPATGLVQASDGDFYGTTALGGAGGFGTSGFGTIFKLSTNGSLTTIYSFTVVNDGGGASSDLVLASDGSLYGITGGGPKIWGTIFRLVCAIGCRAQSASITSAIQ